MLICLTLVGSLLSSVTDEPANDAPARLRPAVVRLQSGTAFRGSGCVVHESKGTLYLLTAGHVVRGDVRKLTVHFFAAEGDEPIRVEQTLRVLAVWDSPDLACLALPKGDYSGPFLKPPGDVGEPPFDGVTFGCDDGAAPTIRKARVAGTKLVRPPGRDGTFHWEITPAPVTGRSGGPLLTAAGRLIGICSGGSGETGYYSTVEEIRFALKSEGLSRVLE